MCRYLQKTIFKTEDYFYICATRGMISTSLFCLQCQLVNGDAKENKFRFWN